MKENKRLNSGSTNKDRIVVIGLDACDADLVERLSKKGGMPFLTSLMKYGVWAKFTPTFPTTYTSMQPDVSTGVCRML